MSEEAEQRDERQDEDEDHAHLEDDGDDDGPSVVSLIARRLKQFNCQTLFNPAFFGSVCTSLGQRAFFAISFSLSAVAFVGQRMARSLRATDVSIGLPKWAEDLLLRFRASASAITGRLRYESVVTRLFAMAAGEDQQLDHTELYCMCLELYCTTTQYMPQVLTPPTRSHTDALFLAFDTESTGYLDREQFICLASVFYEHLLMRIAAQSLISLLVAPLTAAAVVDWLAARHLNVDTTSAAVGAPPNRTLGDATYDALPERLQPLIGSQSIATISLAATMVATLVPATLSLTDEYYLLRAARKTSRSLARRRTLRERSVRKASFRIAGAPSAVDAKAEVMGQQAPSGANPLLHGSESALAESAQPAAAPASEDEQLLPLASTSPQPEAMPLARGRAGLTARVGEGIRSRMKSKKVR